jgi:N4-gp56 family major capsid protein
VADMNITAARSGLVPKSWSERFFVEYVRKSQFSRYMGTSMSSMIQVREDLSRKPGDTVVFATVRRLVGAGVTGNQILEGNEELLNARSLGLQVGVIRHGVAASEWDEQKSILDILDAAKDALQVWSLEKMRADIILSLTAVTADGDVQIPYASATAGQRNTWLTNNSDRVLFGASKSNAASNVMATALATVDATNDKLSASTVSLAKRIAKNANPRIRPITVKDDQEWFVMFADSYAFRDLTLDPTIVASRQYAMARGEDNPLFTGGDIVWDGVIIKEVPELAQISGVGASGINVGTALLCGAQALGVAWAQRTTARTNVRDYNFMHGVAVQEIRGIGKLRFGTDNTTDGTTPKDAGMVTVFVSSVADA